MGIIYFPGSIICSSPAIDLSSSPNYGSSSSSSSSSGSTSIPSFGSGFGSSSHSSSGSALGLNLYRDHSPSHG